MALLVILLLLALSWSSSASGDARALVREARWEWFENRVDHFAAGGFEERFAQRYVVHDRFWRKPDGPILFYTGNEADVGLYVNATGLMWEHAEELGAVLIFAEHRYYGASTIHGNQDLKYMSHDAALADFAALITSFKRNTSATGPVISFGGSYGGSKALLGGFLFCSRSF
jgi:lysosomal Pro-X carboxypeptidase